MFNTFDQFNLNNGVDANRVLSLNVEKHAKTRNRMHFVRFFKSNLFPVFDIFKNICIEYQIIFNLFILKYETLYLPYCH